MAEQSTTHAPLFVVRVMDDGTVEAQPGNGEQFGPAEFDAMIEAVEAVRNTMRVAA